jgi:hypothetical protein
MRSQGKPTGMRRLTGEQETRGVGGRLLREVPLQDRMEHQALLAQSTGPHAWVWLGVGQGFHSLAAGSMDLDWRVLGSSHASASVQ